MFFFLQCLKVRILIISLRRLPDFPTFQPFWWLSCFYLCNMNMTIDSSPAEKLSKLIVVGDRVLIKPKAESERTKTGLFLPPGVEEKEEIGWGWIMKIGPGYPIPIPPDDLEPWKAADERIKYVPLQAKVGDLAIFLKRAAYEVQYQDEKYFIVPQSSILMLERDEDLVS